MRRRQGVHLRGGEAPAGARLCARHDRLRLRLGGAGLVRAGRAERSPGSRAAARFHARARRFPERHSARAESLIWTLNLDATPIYSIFPSGPFAAIAYERLREALQEQKRGTVQLVSVPGYTGGS